MKFRRIWVLDGPNFWANFPVLEAEVDLGDYKDRSSEEMPGFNERLKSWLPTLIEHRCSIGERGGFFQRLERGTYLAHILEHVALELQTLSGPSLGFGRAREQEEEGVYKVAMAFEEPDLAQACMETGRELCMAAVAGTPFDVAAELKKLRDMAHDVRLGPSTSAIVRAAKARGIPYRRLNRGSLVQLGHGARARRILTAETDGTGAIAEAVAQDKELTRSLLRTVGAPVPEGRPATDAEDAWAAAQEIGGAVVVKPQCGNHGRGVATNLTTYEQVTQAYAAALEEGAQIIVEQYAPGHDHRLLVVGNRLVAAALREPAQVIGDGVSTIRQLVAKANEDPRRSDGHATSLSFIKLDSIGLAVVAEQGFNPDSIPPQGVKVLIRRNGNLSTGGTAADVTDLVHPEVAARAIDAARVVGLDIAGVDIVALDIGRPLEEQAGAIVEVNAGPGLRMHIEPSAGTPRPVGEAVVSLLFTPEDNGRIPIAAVSGRGAAATTRLLAHLWGQQCPGIGMATSDGLSIGGRMLDYQDSTHAKSARSILLNPRTEAALLEINLASVVREGLGFDRCSVAIVTEVGDGGNLLGQYGLDTLDKLVRAERTALDVVLPTGTGVLNADDPQVAGMAERCKGAVIYYSHDPQNPIVVQHRAAGGRALLVCSGQLTLAEGGQETPIAPLACSATTNGHSGGHPGGVSATSLLAAVAGAWALGLSAEQLRSGLATYTAHESDATQAAS